MLVSPFTFYRGAAAVMAADLAGTPRSGFDVQLCGDAHLSNFGAYASPDRELVFDVNDFDETLPGPWEWDVMRLAASFSVAGRERGFKRRERLAIVAAMAAEYRAAMRRMAGLGNLEVWYTKIDVEAIAEGWEAAAGEKEVATFRRNLEKTRAKDRMRALSKLTREVDGELRIVSEPPLIVPLDELVDEDADDRSGGAEDHRRLPRDAARGPPRPARRLPLRRRRAQGGRGRQRRHPRLHRADAGARRAATRSSSRPRKRSARCSSPTPSRAPSRTRASASSRASA